MSSRKRRRDHSYDRSEKSRRHSHHDAPKHSRNRTTTSRSRSPLRTTHHDKSGQRRHKEHKRDDYNRGNPPVKHHKRPKRRSPSGSDSERRPRGSPCRGRVHSRSDMRKRYSSESDSERNPRGSPYRGRSRSSSGSSRRYYSDSSRCSSMYTSRSSRSFSRSSSERTTSMRRSRTPSPSSNDKNKRPKRNQHHDREKDKDGKVDSSTGKSGETSALSKNQPKVNAELLDLLGESFQEMEKGPAIHAEVAKIWQQICQKGFSKEPKEGLIKKHLIPENCIALKAPLLNSEVKSAVGKSIQRRDHFQIITQNQLGSALSALAKALSKLMTEEKITDEVKKLCFEWMSDAGKLLTDLHHQISVTRRALISPSLKQLAINVADDAEIDDYLYGQNFSEKLKTAKEVEKVGNELTKQERFERRGNYVGTRNFYKNQRTRNDLNSRAPLRRNTQTSRYPRGQRQQYNTRGQSRGYRKK